MTTARGTVCVLAIVGVLTAAPCPLGATSGDVEVVPGFHVAAAAAPSVALFLRHAALATGQAVELDGELVPLTLDLPTWERLAECESGRRWNYRGRYRGGLQFLTSTWHLAGGAGDPADAPIAEQIERARSWQAIAGWGQWPGCARALGLS